MELPLRIKYVGLPRSTNLGDMIHAQSAPLAKLGAQVEDFEVSVEAWTLHHRQGRQFRVAIELSLVGVPITLSRTSRLDPERSELGALIREAFDDLLRRVDAAPKAVGSAPA